MSLKAFLNPIKVENKKVVISDRFVEDGKPVPFEIRPITQKENSALMAKHTKKDKRTGNEVRNSVNYSNELVANAVVFPDLKNAELQSAYNTVGHVDLLIKMLTVGEFAILTDEVMELSGLDEDINKDIDDVKNA